MVNHITFNGTFAGLPGEDLEYIDNVEIHGKKCEPNNEEGRESGKRRLKTPAESGSAGMAAIPRGPETV